MAVLVVGQADSLSHRKAAPVPYTITLTFTCDDEVPAPKLEGAVGWLEVRRQAFSAPEGCRAMTVSLHWAVAAADLDMGIKERVSGLRAAPLLTTLRPESMRLDEQTMPFWSWLNTS